MNAQLEKEIESSRGAMLGWAKRLGLDCEQAEDAVQDCLLKALLNEHKFDPNRSFWAWLRTICDNMMKSMRRTLRVQAQHRSDADSVAEPCDTVDVAQKACDQVLVDSLMSRIKEFSPEDQLLLGYYFCENLSYREIARKTGMNKSTLHYRLNNLLDRLAKDTKVQRN